MTYDEYWYGDPLMVGAFYKADKLRQEKTDADAWLFGSYVLQALQATVGNMFLSKGKEPYRYPKKPILTEERANKEAEKREQEKRERDEAAFARAWMIQFCEVGKNWGKNG
jgi:hypothetical protein